MKVQRYLYGRTSIPQLEQRRGRLRSPAEVAAEAAAPYEAVAQVAGATADILNIFAQNKIDAENADDNATAELNFAMAEASRKQIETQAKAENWAPERYQEAMDSITTNMLNSGESIGERNREKYLQAVTNQAGIWQFQTASNVNIIKFKRSVIKTDESVVLAVEGKNFALANNIINSAVEDGRYSQELANEKLREIADIELGNKMYEGYVKAIDAGTEAEYLANIAEQDIPDLAMSNFISDASEYDKLMKAKNAEKEQVEQLVNERKIINFERAITPDMEDKILHSFADSMELTLDGRRRLFNIRDKEREVRGAGLGAVPDFSSKKYRSFVDELSGVAVGDSVVDRIDWQIANAGKNWVDGDGIIRPVGSLGNEGRNYFNNAVFTEAAFIEALPRYQRLMQFSPNARHGLTEDAAAMFGTALALSKGDPEAASKIWVNYSNTTPEERNVAKQTFNTDVFWSGMETVAVDAGLAWEDAGWFWFDKSASMDAVAKSKLEQAGRTYHTFQMLAGGGENYDVVRRNTAKYSSQIMGMTDFNKGVPVGDVTVYDSESGEVQTLSRLQEQIMSHPVSRTHEEGLKARTILSDDMVGKKVIYQNEIWTIGKPVEIDPFARPLEAGVLGPIELPPGLPEKTIPVNHIEVFTPPTDRVNEYGQRVWGQRYRGGVLLNPETHRVYDWTPEQTPEEMRKTGSEPISTGKTNISGGPVQIETKMPEQNIVLPEF